ncbi:MAG: hypothetical protein AAFX40_00730 [Cyanobacteria bacterium J06639_1]
MYRASIATGMTPLRLSSSSDNGNPAIARRCSHVPTKVEAIAFGQFFSEMHLLP